MLPRSSFLPLCRSFSTATHNLGTRSGVQPPPREQLLATASWVAKQIEAEGFRATDRATSEHEHVLIDCAAEPLFVRGRIPGSQRLGHHAFLKAAWPPVDGAEHDNVPVRSDKFHDLMEELGIGPETRVVVYDDANALEATRVRWVLQYYGHRHVRVLDGGWKGWVSQGGKVETGAVTPTKQRVKQWSRKQPQRIAGLAAVLEASGSGTSGGEEDCGAAQLVDARSTAEFIGVNAMGNSSPGRVPEALHCEWISAIDSQTHCFRPQEKLRAFFDKRGVDLGQPLITYCQAGIRAAHTAFSLELCGAAAVRVYDASMKEYLNQESTPKVVGTSSPQSSGRLAYGYRDTPAQ